VGVYLSEWASPEPGWQQFILLDYILESGSYETCQAMLNFLTEDENDDRPGECIYLFIRLKTVCVLFCQMLYCYMIFEKLNISETWLCKQISLLSKVIFS